MSVSNTAAWFKEVGQPLVIEAAPFPEPTGNEIVIQTTALAINPIDGLVTSTGLMIKEFPTVVGCDIAGRVAAVGPDATNFKVGERVFASSQYFLKGQARFGTFQQYAVVLPPTIAHIPDNISDTDAVVLPLGVDTASAMLFQKQQLGLAMPPTQDGKGKTVLLWGGSTSVGACGTQLLVAAGYEAIVVASQKNAEFCKSLGASKVVDYNSPTVEADLIDAAKGRTIEGAICCVKNDDAHRILCRALAATGGRKMVSSVDKMAKSLACDGAVIDNVFATTVATNEVGPHIWGKFLHEALKNGKFVCKPDAEVLGQGFEYVQKGINAVAAGVSAKKIVIKI